MHPLTTDYRLLTTQKNKRLTIIIALLLTWMQASPQNSPHTSLATIYTAPMGAIDVPVTVWDFDDIGAVYLSVDYDSRVLQLTGATPHAQMPTFLYGDSDLGDWRHRITMGWYGNSLSLPDNAAIMTLHFTFTGGYSELSFYDNGPSCEYANGNGQVLNDIPFWEYYTNGEVCGELPNPGPIYGPTEVCEADLQAVYWVDPEVNATDYIWIDPPYANIIAGHHTNLVVVEFTDNPGDINMQVYITNSCGQMSASAFLPVTVHEKPIAGIQTIPPVPHGNAITLHANNGGSGSYSYHWSPEEIFVDPDVQNPQTVNLYNSDLVKVEVTDLATGCTDFDFAILTVQGGALSVNPGTSHPTICYGSSAWLVANASGGTENFTYAWTSNPPGFTYNYEDPVVTPGITTTYIVTVEDGVDNATDSVTVNVLEPVTATISGTDTLCGTEDVVYFRVEFTGLPPWDFTYRYGLRSVFVEGITSTYVYIGTMEPGIFTIDYVRSGLCEGEGYGEAAIASFPIPPTPVVTQYDNTLVSNVATGNQWYKNGVPIPGATGVSYTATETGTYFDVIHRNGCTGAPSNSINIVIIGIEEGTGGPGDQGTGGRLVLYPNPVGEDVVNIRWSAVGSRQSAVGNQQNGTWNMEHGTWNMELEIYDLFGHKAPSPCLHVPLSPGQNGWDWGLTWQLDVSSLPSGIYFVVLRDDKTVIASGKFVVAR
jgi:hypothetical protein